MKREKLNIITPVSRPQNLSLIRENIINETDSYFDVTWYCIYDIGKNLDIVDFKDEWIISIYGGIANDCAGGSQRNVALDFISEGYVYFLDDDNKLHENFANQASILISTNWDKKGFIFNQDRMGIKENLIALPENIKVNHVDIAQVLLNMELISSFRFRENDYVSDGIFIESIFNKNKQDILLVNEFLCYYNALRQDYEITG